MILAEVRALNEKVANLEKRVAAFESDSEETPAVARAAIEYAAANPPPVEEKSRNKWYENLRVELKKADVRASGNWVKPESWERIETKMTPEEVIAILGEPTDRKFSIRKDTDEVLVPGERGDRVLEERTRDGIPIAPGTWRALAQAAAEHGVDMPATV